MSSAGFVDGAGDAFDVLFEVLAVDERGELLPPGEEGVLYARHRHQEGGPSPRSVILRDPLLFMFPDVCMCNLDL